MTHISNSIVAPLAGYVHIRSALVAHLVSTAKMVVRWSRLGPASTSTDVRWLSRE